MNKLILLLLAFAGWLGCGSGAKSSAHLTADFQLRVASILEIGGTTELLAAGQLLVGEPSSKPYLDDEGKLYWPLQQPSGTLLLADPEDLLPLHARADSLLRLGWVQLLLTQADELPKSEGEGYYRRWLAYQAGFSRRSPKASMHFCWPRVGG
ncbi:MAG: hypothetical protein HC821_01240 [Lewinella sp.]|nr:hypothetical protein [Lewinella sp.]